MAHRVMRAAWPWPAAVALGLAWSLAGCMGAGPSGEPSGSAPGAVAASTAAAAAATSTAAVLCSYSHEAFNPSPSVKASSSVAWRCDGGSRQLSGNGLPDHAVGAFPGQGNPNRIAAQNVKASMPLSPVLLHASGQRVKVPGFALNGVKFDPGTAGTCDDSGKTCDPGGGDGNWRMEALGQSVFKFGADASNGHAQPDGSYHYHGIPEGLLAARAQGAAAGSTMTLVGWAVDGFPIYARHGHTVAADGASPLKVLRASWQHKPTPDAGRPATSVYPMGAFGQDWQYVAGSGDLDECNGRVGVTPEFPRGIYHYLVTDSYPFVPRCVKGDAPAGADRGPDGPGGRGRPDRPERPERPAPEALAACRSLTEGQACSVATPRGQISGNCLAPAGLPLACRPAGGPGDARGRDRPPRGSSGRSAQPG